ncbi:MAG: hypothetical protein HPY75_09025 [Actinobacteria bacterium]|nr:hypothetical protein [Actinomycetota bacterium]
MSNEWWKTLSLFLWFYNTSATAVLLVYFAGICRMAEHKFGGRTLYFLLPVFFVLMGASTLIYSMSDSIVAIKLWYAVWPMISGLILLVVVYRAYRLMMGR